MTFPQGPKDSDISSKSLERTESPGPQSYRVNSGLVLSKNPSAIFGSSTRNLNELIAQNNDSPGPGDYTI